MSDGASILSDLGEFIRRFVALSPMQVDVCALWVLHTHAIEAADFTPYLNITSPLPRSGKTTLLQLLALLAAKDWFTGRVTAAVLVRKTDKEHPTLLLDESDAAFQANREYAEALRGLLNTGYERDGRYSMCVPAGNDWVAKDFFTFCPKAIAGIGGLPDTVEDRSIPMRLKRKLPSEKCEPFRKRKVKPPAEDLRTRVAQWAIQNKESLGGAEPEMPSDLNDRQQDVCEPLIAIADLVGGQWPERARQALISLLAAQSTGEDPIRARLLADIKLCFEKPATERMKRALYLCDGTLRIRTSHLLEGLKAIDESPWAEYRRGHPLSPYELARLLKPFGIRPCNLRFANGVYKGYEQKDFEDAWMRYVPTPDLQGATGATSQC
jgi:hypothetical protein